MFVDIEDFKSALVVENILTSYKKGRFAQDKKNTSSQRADYSRSLYGNFEIYQLCPKH